MTLVRLVAAKAVATIPFKVIDKLKDRVRQLSPRTRGHKVKKIVEELRASLLGWKAYFGITEVCSPLVGLDQWIR